MLIHRNAPVCFAILFVVGTAQSVSAMETEVTLNQDKAISGGITPVIHPGFPTTTVIDQHSKDHERTYRRLRHCN